MGMPADHPEQVDRTEPDVGGQTAGGDDPLRPSQEHVVTGDLTDEAAADQTLDEIPADERVAAEEFKLNLPSRGEGKPAKPVVSAVGKTIGDYRIEAELGRGGMGVVYRAYHRRLKRTVALKMIIAGVHASRDALERFMTEAQSVAHLQHPNIVQIFEIGEHEGLPYFSLEYVDGRALDDKLEENTLGPRQAAELVATLADAMQYAHDANIVHRDIKPGNILLGKDGTPKISDFGLAKQLGDDSSSTQTGMVLGTPSYMSPEQASGKVREIGPATDQYSLGALLYRLLTGRPPFIAAKAIETVRQVIRDEPVAPRQLSPQVPVDLDTICLKTLQKEISGRYASCAELAADLRRYLAGEPIIARKINNFERFWRWCRRNPRVAIPTFSAAALLLVATCVSTWAAITIAGQSEVIKAERDYAQQQEELAKAETKRAEQNEEIAQGQAQLAIGTLQEVLTNVDNQLAADPSMVQLRADVLQSLSASWDKIYDVVRTDLQSQSIPTLMAVRMKLAGVFRQTGRGDAALAEIEKLHEMGLQRVEVKQGTDATRRNMASICLVYGDIREEVQRDQQLALEKYEEGLRWIQDVVDQPKPGSEPGGPTQHIIRHILGSAHQRVGKAHLLLGDLQQADEHFTSAFEVRTKLLDSIDDDTEFTSQSSAYQKQFRADLQSSLDRSALALGTLLLARGKTDEGLQRFEQVWQGRKAIAEAEGASIADKLELAEFSGNYGFVCIKVDQFDRAAELLQPYVDFFESLEDRYKQNFDVMEKHALAYYRLGVLTDVLQKQGAQDWFVKSRDLRQKIYDKNQASERDKSMLMVAEARSGNWPAAEKLADQLGEQTAQNPKQQIERARAYLQSSRVAGDRKQELVDKSLQALKRAVEEGFNDRFELTHEPDLVPLRDNPEFIELVSSLDSVPHLPD